MTPRRRRAGVREDDRPIGLSLAGGGHAGAVYEIGALWALQEALEGIDLSALSCYVGVSAGALVASCLANGMRPELLARIVLDEAPDEEPLDADIFLSPNYRSFLRLAVLAPQMLARTALRRPWSGKGPRRDPSLLAALARASSLLPLGLFDNEPIRRYLARVFAREGRTDDFGALATHLVIVAADLESGRPIRFGFPAHPHVPISRAVQASTALPGIYPPVAIDGRQCVDGVLLKTLHASVALEEGTELLFCINPIAPIDAAALAERGVLPPGALLDHGLPAVLSQTFRTLVHSRLETGIASYADRFPDADVVLFEPAPDAHELFFANPFSLGARHETCAIGYRTTRDQLRARAAELAPILARHGITIDGAVLADEDRDIRTGLRLGAPRAKRRAAATR